MNSVRILVLEDHAFQRAVALAALESLGYQQVLWADEGASALRLLRAQGGVDVVICDLRMMGMDGLEFLRQASRTGLAGAVILCSEVDVELRLAVAQMVMKTGIQVLGDIGKPLVVATLAELLERYSRITCTEVDLFEHARPRVDFQQLPHALSRGEFQAVFDPQFYLHTGEVFAVQVSPVWQSPHSGEINASVFMPKVESQGLTSALFKLLLTQGFSFLSETQGDSAELKVSFSLFSSLLQSPELIADISSTLEYYSIVPGRVIFEVDESAMVNMPDSSLGNLIRLRMMGCRLAIDGFGEGLTSFQKLCEWPFQQLKINVSLLPEPGGYSTSRGLLGGALSLADTLEMEVVVVGVKSAQQRRQLLDLGCSLAQGEWFVQPMTAPQMLDWLHLRDV